MSQHPIPVSDTELKNVVETALRTGGCYGQPCQPQALAGVVAEHIVTWLALEGIRAVRGARDRGLT